MPNSAYTQLSASFAFCPTATIPAGIPLQTSPTSVVMAGFSASFADPLVVGMGVMVNDEIMTLQSFNGNNLVLLRGCADTIPQSHPPGSRIWFFEASTGRVPQEYASNETISVKLLPRTSAGGFVPIAGSPPIGVALNSRFARPYPPGSLQVNGQPWHLANVTMNGDVSLVFSWATRNRVTQADVLVPHTASSVAPENGQLTRIQMFRASDNSLRATYDVEGTSFTYTAGSAITDLGGSGGQMYALVGSVRGNLASRSSYRLDFTVEQVFVVTQAFGFNYSINEPPAQSFTFTYAIRGPVSQIIDLSFGDTIPAQQILDLSFGDAIPAQETLELRFGDE